MGNSLVQQKPNAENLTFSKFMQQSSIKNKIANVVQGKDGQRFITSIISVVSTNPAIAACQNFSILSAALLGESLKLSPSPQLGHYYIVPFKDTKNNVTNAQFILGYKGYIQLAIRSGMYRKILVTPVKEVEFIEWDKFDEKILINKAVTPLEVENSKTAGYYAEIELINGFRKALYWSFDKMQLHADRYSQAFSMAETSFTDKFGKKRTKVSYEDYMNKNYDPKDEWLYSSFWYKDFNEMACKTMLRQIISKWGVQSIELQNALQKDEEIFNEKGEEVQIDIPQQNIPLIPENTQEKHETTSKKVEKNVEVPVEPQAEETEIFNDGEDDFLSNLKEVE